MVRVELSSFALKKEMERKDHASKRQKEISCLQMGRQECQEKSTLLILDLELAASRTVRKEIPLA